MKTEYLNNIINHINSIKAGKNEKRGICILLGAGADISSGGILFRELKLNFLKECNINVTSDIKEPKLNLLFEEAVNQCSQSGRCETLEKIMKRYNAPSEGYELLVLLAKLKYIDAVITTNFDYLLEETQDILNIHPFTVYAPGMAIPEEYYSRRSEIGPIYLKMHGDLYGRLVTHLTQEEISSLPYGDAYIKLFEHLISRNSLFLIGYGGYDTLITEIFKKNIDTVSNVYWCNVAAPDKNSELANTLEENDKITFVKSSFDEFFQSISLNILKEEMLTDSNSIFLPTILKSKIAHQQTLFSRKICKENKLVERLNIKEQLEEFLLNYSTKCVILKGAPKSGKTCFLYKYMKETKDIDFLPILCDNKRGILDGIALALGYNTNVPFSLVYNFCKWCNSLRKHIIFVLDDFFNNDYLRDDNIEYVIELSNFLCVTKEFHHVQFILSFQDSVYDKFIKIRDLQANRNLFEYCIDIGKLSDREVNMLIKYSEINYEDISEDIRELLHEPYIWQLIHQNHLSGNDFEGNNFFEVYIDKLYLTTTESDGFTKHSLNDILGKIAYNEIMNQNKPINIKGSEYRFLQKQGVIDFEGHFAYQRCAIYFCACYILNKLSPLEEIVENIIVPSILKPESLTENQIKVYSVILSHVKSINDFPIILGLLNSILLDGSGEKRKKIVLCSIDQLIRKDTKYFKDYINTADLSIYSKELLECLFKIFSENMPDLLLAFLKHKDMSLSYGAFVITSDKLYADIKRQLLNEGDIDIFTKVKNNLSQEYLFSTAIYLCSYFGWDNLRLTEYRKMIKLYKKHILPMTTCPSTEVLKDIVKKLKKYSYNFFFNAGDDLEEQYISMIHNEELCELIRFVLDGNGISLDKYMLLMQLSVDYNNSWIFILANLIVVQSMHNDAKQTYFVLSNVLEENKTKILVQQLDFYLSSIFWASYIHNPNDRQKFVKLFENVINNYETLLFEFPSNKRRSTIRKFTDEFDVVFEDGFNPLAFYFYTAPYESLMSEHFDWNYGKKDLIIYWDLADTLEKSGNYSAILRLVHAIGQMISIYPSEGYEALENLLPYDHAIIKKGMIRILKENYIRYPNETKKFIKSTKLSINENDLKEIYLNTTSYIENRSFEQLHWARLFYNYNKILGKDLVQIFLQQVLNSNSCDKFINNFLKDLFE